MCCLGEGRRLGRRPQDEQVLVHTMNRIQTVLQATRHVPRSSSWQWLKTQSPESKASIFPRGFQPHLNGPKLKPGRAWA